jgi:hypothetical protein
VANPLVSRSQCRARHFPGSLVFISCRHTDNNLTDAAFFANRDAWQAKMDARCPGSQTVWLTQNPKYADTGTTSTVDLVRRSTTAGASS